MELEVNFMDSQGHLICAQEHNKIKFRVLVYDHSIAEYPPSRQYLSYNLTSTNFSVPIRAMHVT
jgi:hypothetical protein